MEFRDLINSCPLKVRNGSEEARFSFFHGGYVEDFDLQGSYLFPYVHFVAIGMIWFTANVIMSNSSVYKRKKKGDQV